MENFEGALNQIIKLMNISAKEKIKRVEVLTGIEKKVVRRLRNGKSEEAIQELKDIIDEYKRLGLFQKAEVLQLALNQYILETEILKSEKEESPSQDYVDDKHDITQVLEARTKKVIRRFIQGKIDDAIEEMHKIIAALREIKMLERADALEQWMIEFLQKKLDEDERDIPLAELIEEDPALEEQLLSFRTQKVIKRFAEGKPRQAVNEFTEIVNEYKRKGKLQTVEMLEIWFNLFITKMYLVPVSPAQPATSPSLTAPQSPTTSPPFVSSILSASILNASTPSQQEEVSPPSPDKIFKDKISKIKTLLKTFEDSLT